MNRKFKTLVLVTEGFPLSGVTEREFVMPELGYLLKEFGKVYLLPLRDDGLECELPKNVILDKSLSTRPTGWDKIKELRHPLVWKRLYNDVRYCGLKRLRMSMAYSVYAFHYERQIKRFIKKEGLDPENTLYYTFWFEYVTSALCLVGNLKIFTRTHGHDMYERDDTYVSRAWRLVDFKNLKACCAVSRAGFEYMKDRYPQYADKIWLSFLGSRAPQSINPGSSSRNRIVILCCARLSHEKRVPFQMDLIKEFAERHPEYELIWHQIGGGAESGEVKEKTFVMPPNVKVWLHGEKPNSYVRDFLNTRHVDVMMLTSKYEGGVPIAICEAMSFGIPVLATNVGGVPEIVNDENGALLSSDPDADEFCEKLLDMIPRLPEKRIMARRDWEAGFQVESVRRDFAVKLASLLDDN